jgi:undecaprenyl pyrophosphate phosphatase UppP
MNDDIKGKLTYIISLMVAATLCFSVAVIVIALVLGLWFENIDNAEIFKTISAPFNAIVGGFIGLLAGMKLSNNDSEPPCRRKNDD